MFDYERLKHLDRRRVARLRGLLEAASVKVKAGGRLKISGDEEDNRIYECAVAAKADYIVTENIRHFKKPYKTRQIITAGSCSSSCWLADEIGAGTYLKTGYDSL